MVLDVDPANRRISLGLEADRAEPVGDGAASTIRSAATIKGKVKSITDFGVFVGVDEGIDGLVHVSDLHWTKKVKHPSELYKKGDDVEAVVLGDRRRQRAHLARHQAARRGSVEQRAARYPIGTRVNGHGHERHRLRRLRRDRGGHRGPDPRLASSRPSGSTSRGSSSRSATSVEAEVTQRRRARAADRALASRRCAAARSATRSTAYLRREREGAKFSFEDILSEELRLDRDEGDRPAKAKSDATSRRRASAMARRHPIARGIAVLLRRRRAVLPRRVRADAAATERELVDRRWRSASSVGVVERRRA